MAIHALLLVSMLEAATLAPVAPSGLPLSGLAAEEFLRTAEVVEMSRIQVGVSRPHRVVLSDGTRTLRAAFKTIDRFEPLTRFARGKPQMSFRDSYHNEIAAYELDKLLGLGMVPPTVERRINGTPGSLQLWVEGAMTEWERKEQDLHSEDRQGWNVQMHTVRLFHQLVSDSDYNNIRNLLVDSEYRLYIIDSSRAFRIERTLRKEESLLRFSRATLERLEGLGQNLVEQRLGRWLSRNRIRALLERRDRILARARSLVNERGETAVLYD